MSETFFDRVKRQTGHEIQFSAAGVAEKCPYEYGLESERAVNLCEFNPDKVPWNDRCRACWNREIMEDPPFYWTAMEEAFKEYTLRQMEKSLNPLSAIYDRNITQEVIQFIRSTVSNEESEKQMQRMMVLEKIDHSRLSATLRRACIERHIGFPIVNRPGFASVRKSGGFYWADGEEE